MKKILIICCILFASGCSMSMAEPYGSLTGVTVKDKRFVENVCLKPCADEYYTTFEKDGQEVELRIYNENLFNALKKGAVVDVTYNFEYAVEDLSFPQL